MEPPPEEVVWCLGEWQPGYGELKNVRFVEWIPDVDTWKPGKRRLLVLDDLMTETDERVTKLFTKGSHHKNMSIIYITQILFSKNKKSRTIHLNSNYIVLFKNPRDATQITFLARQMMPGRTKLMLDAYKDATTQPHGYLVVDLKQDTSDLYQLRTNIFPREVQVVCIPK
ncbi:hypothetical protein ACOMHN_021846 [Nucella lapillus]